MAPPYQEYKDQGTRMFYLPHTTSTTTLEASSCPTKKNISSKNCTQLDSLPYELYHNIDMWNGVLVVHHNKLKPVLVRFTQHHTVLCESTSYEIKYIPFDYYRYYYHIKYVWTHRRLGPQNSIHKWGK